jgi:hypothetical protein
MQVAKWKEASRRCRALLPTQPLLVAAEVRAGPLPNSRPLQRRHQKILEETPSPFVTPELRAALQGAAVRLGRLAKYRWAAPHTAHCPHSLDSRRCTLLGGGNGSLGWQGCREVVEAP